MLKHNITHYDENLNLKVPFLLWGLMLFGMRDFLGMICFTMVPNLTDDFFWIDLHHNYRFIVCNFLVGLVLFTTGHRLPESHSIFKIIWLNGKKILLVAYLIDIAFLISFGFSNVLMDLLVTLIDFFSIYYLVNSELVDDLFGEFPKKGYSKTK